VKQIPNIYLASNSPRRKSMFEFYNLKFETINIDFDESFTSTNPEGICREICQGKLDTALDKIGKKHYEEAITVVADTLVFFDGKIYGKPNNKDEARRMLSSLSGNEHSVITAVGMCVLGEKEVFIEKTLVKFIDLSPEMIENYLGKEVFSDKAGSYAIQSERNFFVESISGSYTNVVGFPMQSFLEKIKKCLEQT
jgi:septum formation protein